MDRTRRQVYFTSVGAVSAGKQSSGNNHGGGGGGVSYGGHFLHIVNIHTQT